MSNPTYTIICADGEVRHSAPFATATAAANWLYDHHMAECGGPEYHEVEVTDVNGQTWPPVVACALPIQLHIERERMSA